MEDFISALLGGTHLASSVLTSPGTCRRVYFGIRIIAVVGPGDGGGLTCRHLVEALLHDPEALPHLRHALQVSVVAVSVAAHRNVEIHQIIRVIGLGLPQIILDTWKGT